MLAREVSTAAKTSPCAKESIHFYSLIQLADQITSFVWQWFSSLYFSRISFLGSAHLFTWANSSLDFVIFSALSLLVVLESVSTRSAMPPSLPLDLDCPAFWIFSWNPQWNSACRPASFSKIQKKMPLSEFPLYFFNFVLLSKLLFQLRLTFSFPIVSETFLSREHTQLSVSKPNLPYRSALKPTSFISYRSQQCNNLSISHTRDLGFVSNSFFSLIVKPSDTQKLGVLIPPPFIFHSLHWITALLD